MAKTTQTTRSNAANRMYSAHLKKSELEQEKNRNNTSYVVYMAQVYFPAVSRWKVLLN